MNWNPRALTPAENGHPFFVWPDQGASRDWSALTVDGDPEILTLDHPAVKAASQEILRPIVPKS